MFSEQDLVYAPRIDGSNYRAHLIESGLLRPRQVVADGPTRELGLDLGPVLRIDHAGKLEAEKNIARFRAGDGDREHRGFFA